MRSDGGAFRRVSRQARILPGGGPCGGRKAAYLHDNISGARAYR